MAEIRIEKKRGISPLLWILILIALIAAIWYGMQRPIVTGIAPSTGTVSSTT